MPTQAQQWQEFFSSGFYFEAYSFRVGREKTEEEVQGVLRLLNPNSNSHILDWCGGYGRHSVILAQMGFKMTLLDWAPNHIQTAQAAAQAAKVQVQTVCADFRQTPAHIQADYAVNLFTSGIGYLTEEDDVCALKALHAALKPEAKFLLDTMNLFWLVKNYQPKGGEMSADGSRRLVEFRQFDFWTNRNLARTQYWDAGGRDEIREHGLRIYSPAELCRGLKKAGFEPLELYGGFDGRPIGFDTQRLIIISQRV